MIKYRVIYEGGYTEYPEDKMNDAIALAEEKNGKIDKFDVTFTIDGKNKKSLELIDYDNKPETIIVESLENLDSVLEAESESTWWNIVKGWFK